MDTQSNANYALAKHVMPREYRPWETTHCTGTQIALDPTVSVGSLFVAVLDSSGDNHYHVAKVTDVTDTNVWVHYHGDKSRKIRGIKCASMYHHPGTNLVVQHDV